MHVGVVLAVIGAVISTSPAAQDPGEPQAILVGDSLVRRNAYELRHDGALGGPAFAFLLGELENAQFVLLAEPHNTNQVNQFAGMLFEALHGRFGFQHLVVEQDGLIMDRLAAAGAEGDLAAVRSEAATHPDALHFGTDAELALITEVSRISDAPDPVWGIDRVHDATLALEALLDAAESEADREEILAVLAEAQLAPDASFIREPSAAFDELLASLDPPDGSAAAEVLIALTISRDDFRAYTTKHEPGDPWGFLANQRREELMKTRFLQHYRRATAGGEKLPKAVAKLGHWHIMRGLGPGNVPTLGDFLVDVARFNGKDAVSINLQPVNERGRHWSITDYPEYAPVTGVADPDKWMLVDLRPLRGYVHSGALQVSSDLRQMIFGYDLLLLLGGTDPGRTTWRD